MFYCFFRHFNSFRSFLTSTEPFGGFGKKPIFLECDEILEQGRNYRYFAWKHTGEKRKGCLANYTAKSRAKTPEWGIKSITAVEKPSEEKRKKRYTERPTRGHTESEKRTNEDPKPKPKPTTIHVKRMYWLSDEQMET